MILFKDEPIPLFINRYEYKYFNSCTCRYRVPIPILLRFGFNVSAINLQGGFIFLLVARMNTKKSLTEDQAKNIHTLLITL